MGFIQIIKDADYSSLGYGKYQSLINITPTGRVLFDLGSDIFATPSSDKANLKGQDAAGKWWNNLSQATVRGTYPKTYSTNPVDTNNIAVQGFSLAFDKNPGATTNPDGDSNNSGGAASAVGDYPITATQDSYYCAPAAGIITITLVMPRSATYVKFWGSRSNVTDARITQIRKKGDTAWVEYDATNNTNYSQASIFTNVAANQQFEMQCKSGSLFGYFGVIDIQLS